MFSPVAIILTTFESDANIELAHFRHSSVLDVDAGQFLRDRSHRMDSVRSDPLFKSPIAPKYLPGISNLTNYYNTCAEDACVIIQSMPDDAPSVGVTRLIDAVTIRAVV